MNKTKKVALVTGASAGLGREFAKQLAGQGCELVLVARRDNVLEKIAAEIVENWPGTVCAERSPYPTVVSVVNVNQNACHADSPSNTTMASMCSVIKPRRIRAIFRTPRMICRSVM